MEHKYGNFSNKQINNALYDFRKSIFFLLLIADPENKSEYKHIDVDEAFTSLCCEIDGLNSILSYPSELVHVLCLLEKAKTLYATENFQFKRYRKLILDAGNEVLKLTPKGGDDINA